MCFERPISLCLRGVQVMAFLLSPEQIIALVRSGLGLLKTAGGLLHRKDDLRRKSRRSLYFVDRLSYWDIQPYGPDKVVILEADFTITNPNLDDGNLLITRAQVRRAGFLVRGPREEAQYVLIDDEKLFPGRVGIPIPGRTSTVLYVRHGLVGMPDPPHNKKLRFKIVLTDQFKRTHAASIRVPKLDRSAPVALPPSPGGQPTAVALRS